MPPQESEAMDLSKYSKSSVSAKATVAGGAGAGLQSAGGQTGVPTSLNPYSMMSPSLAMAGGINTRIVAGRILRDKTPNTPAQNTPE